jgi:pimeloyl-ACP methyl ester carboxylesterase
MSIGSSLRSPVLITGVLVTALTVVSCASPEATPPTAPSSTTITPASLADFYSQDVDWRNCGNADCTTFEVPLNYNDPDGPRVTLSMTRVTAKGESIGSLFVNPGGPGGSAVDYAKAADFITTAAVREVFDLVGVDPRGVGLSEPIDCLTDEQTDIFMAGDASPDTELEESRLILDSSMVGESCAAKENPLLGHMSTVEVAKDMDIARALVGDPVMNLIGKSYGTAIGTTYMNLFPDRVGRIVLDGVLPTYLDQLAITRGQAEEFEIMLRYFVEDCLGQSDCPLTGNIDQGVQQVRNFLIGLDAQPLIGSGDRELTEGLGSYAILMHLYFPETDFAQLRPALKSAMNDRDPQKLLEILDRRINRTPDGRYTDNSTDAFYAVSCLDLPVNQSVDQIREFVDTLEVSAPTFGRALGWGVITCKDWPFQIGFTKPELVVPTQPIMIVVTEFDPATPAVWGRELGERLVNVEVVEWQGGYNHTGYNEGNDCVTQRVDSYLIEGAISPGVTTVCD